jgi:spermidine synthase
MLDAYNSDYIPFHLMTKEFLSLVKSKLKTGGIVLQNVWTSNRLLKRILTTFKSVYKYVYFAKGKVSGNGVILASNRPFDFSNRNMNTGFGIFKKSKINYPFAFIDYLKRYRLYTENVSENLILTDEHAPVNFYHRR